MITPLGVPFRLAVKLDNIVGLGNMRDNGKEMVRKFSIKRDCTENAST